MDDRDDQTIPETHDFRRNARSVGGQVCLQSDYHANVARWLLSIEKLRLHCNICAIDRIYLQTLFNNIQKVPLLDKY